jgi:hypothetical protein
MRRGARSQRAVSPLMRTRFFCRREPCGNHECDCFDPCEPQVVQSDCRARTPSRPSRNLTPLSPSREPQKGRSPNPQRNRAGTALPPSPRSSGKQRSTCAAPSSQPTTSATSCPSSSFPSAMNAAAPNWSVSSQTQPASITPSIRASPPKSSPIPTSSSEPCTEEHLVR